MNVKGVRLGVVAHDLLAPRDLAHGSRAALHRALAKPAELTVGVVSEEAVLLGAFQRGTEVDRALVAPETPFFRRGSGGPAVRVGPGSVYVALTLPHPAALMACDPPRILNRYVRPLLRALTKLGATAHYFGRDWVSVAHRPAAWIGFGHVAATGRTLVEAVVAVRTPFALGPRPGFLGKVPGTLEGLTGRTFEMATVTKVIVDAYLGSYEAEPVPIEAALRLAERTGEPEEDVFADPPWKATALEAIGLVAAGRDHEGVLRLGGELLASEDAVHTLEARLAEVPMDAPDDAFAPLVDQALGAPNVAIHGVRSLQSILDVLSRGRWSG